jgi:hypothetical protein
LEVVERSHYFQPATHADFNCPVSYLKPRKTAFAEILLKTRITAAPRVR